MSTELVRNQWASVLHYPEDRILELRWLPTDAPVTESAWKAVLALFVFEAEQVRVPYLLVDTRQFKAEGFGDGVDRWREDFIMPRYGAAGTEKLAFLAPVGVPATIEAGGSEMIEPSAIFPTAWFSERANVEAWFRHEQAL
jgi:hypothetical protein